MYKKQNLLGFNINAGQNLSPLKSQTIRTETNTVTRRPVSPSPSSTQNPEITFLKNKLVETHKKLLSQLQRQKQYQKQIMKLTQQIQRLRSVLLDKNQQIHILNDDKKKLQKQTTSKYDIKIKLPQSDHNQSKSRQNKLKQSRSAFQETSRLLNQIKTLKTQINRYQLSLESEIQQNKELTKKLESMKKKISDNQVDHEEEMKLVQSKAGETRRLQIEIQSLQQQNSLKKQRIHSLQNKIQSLQAENYEIKSQLSAHLRQRSYSSNRNRALDQLKYQNNRLTSLLQQKQRELDSTRIKLKSMQPKKKKGFEQTRRMIEKLQQVQHMTRSRGTISRNMSQSTLGRSKKDDGSFKKDRKRIQKEMTFYAEDY